LGRGGRLWLLCRLGGDTAGGVAFRFVPVRVDLCVGGGDANSKAPAAMNIIFFMTCMFLMKLFFLSVLVKSCQQKSMIKSAWMSVERKNPARFLCA